MGLEQLDLPLFGNLPTGEPSRRAPQPHRETGHGVTDHDILYGPLDLHNRGRFHDWLEGAQQEHGFALEDLLPEPELYYVQRYLYPQPPDGRWLSQPEALGEKHPSDFRHMIVRAMVRVRRREMFGPRALEILKPEKRFYHDCRRAGLTTIDDLLTLPPEDLLVLCATRHAYDWLEETMKQFQPDWTVPVVSFPDELPPWEAYDYRT